MVVLASKYRWISGGRGSLKLSGTTKRPLALPGRRSFFRRATGCPALVMIASSPRANSLMRGESRLDVIAS